MNGIQLQRISKYRRADLDDEETSSNLSVPADACAMSASEQCLPHIHYTSNKPYKRNFWERATPLERLLLITVGALLIIIIVLSAVLDYYSKSKHSISVVHVTSANTTTTSPSSPEYCLTLPCITVAGSILNSMDLETKPCDDFYQYACGGWIKSNPLPDGQSIWGTFGKLWQENQLVMKNVLEKSNSSSSAEKKARIYYFACLDKNDTLDKLGAKPMLDLLVEVGGWHAAKEFNISEWSFETALKTIHNRYNRGGLYSWGVGEDEKNSSYHIIQLDQGGLGLPSRDYYLNQTKKPDVMPAYLSYMTRIGVLLGGEENSTRQQMEDVIEFETRIAEITIPAEERRDDEKLYNKITIEKLQKLAPFQNWLSYFNFAFKKINKKLESQDSVIVYAPTFFHNMSMLISEYLETPEKSIILNNYLGWSLVQSMSSYLSKPFREAFKILRKALIGSEGGETLWRYCVTDTNGVLGFALGAMFVREVFHGSSKAMAEQMIDEVRDAFIDNFPLLKWMDKQTIALAKEKANAITNMIGFPDFINDIEKLDKKYENLTFKENEYFSNNVRYSQYSLIQNMAKLDKKANRSEWEMSPPTVNAYYTPTKNQIVFPAGILQSPFYDPNYPKSLNFGAMGVVMGHELTHAFDDQGREYDKEGNMHQWWKNSTIESFDKRIKCFADQYSSYKVNNENLNGKQTLGENIADNGGLKAAFHAYEGWIQHHAKEHPLPGVNLTHNQLFFVGFAQVWCGSSTPEASHLQVLNDPHSPANLRVLGALSNSYEFASHFKCPENSPMNPKKKCEVW